MATRPIAPDDPGDHGKFEDPIEVTVDPTCCEAGNVILGDILEALEAPIEVNVTNEVEIANDVDNPIPVTGSLTISSVVSAFTHGQNTDVDLGAAEQIVVASNPATTGVIVKALPGNLGILYVGNDNTVTTATGFPLESGETITLEVDDANKIWVIADIDNQGLAWVAT